MSKGGPWLQYAPGSEQEVVVLFGMLLPHLPFRIVLDEVRQAFPDCLAYRIEPDGTRVLVRIEFELRASNFVYHEHDPSGCDLIVCWEDDLPSFIVPRLALRQIALQLADPLIAEPDRAKYIATHWQEETFLNAAPDGLREMHRELLVWAKGLGTVVFGSGPKEPSWTLHLRTGDGIRLSLFAVYADGRAWPFPGELTKASAPHETVFRHTLATYEPIRAKALASMWFTIHLSDPSARLTLTRSVEAVFHGLTATAAPE